jgi:hypothetical protein
MNSLTNCFLFQPLTCIYIHVLPGVRDEKLSSSVPSTVSERISAVKAIHAIGARWPQIDLRVFRPCVTVQWEKSYILVVIMLEIQK